MLVAGLDAVSAVLLVDVIVGEAQLANDAAALIRKERVGDAILIGEAGQRLDRVVADGEGGVAVGRQLGLDLLQLDELRFAEGSPLGAAVEHDHGPPAGPRRVEVDVPARLVRQPDVRETLADLGPDRGKLEDKRHVFVPPL